MGRRIRGRIAWNIVSESREWGRRGTYHRKFGGVLRALKMRNWKIGAKFILYAALGI
jgi:hypothetical protein